MAPKGLVAALTVVGLALGAAAWVWAAAPESPRAATNVEDAKTGAAPTFYKDVLPIAQAHCQTCHRPGQIGPFSLLDYQSARPWAAAIKTDVASKKMPPWYANPEYGHFDNDRSLNQAENDPILSWVNAGAPAADPPTAPPPVHWPACPLHHPPEVPPARSPAPLHPTGADPTAQLVLPGRAWEAHAPRRPRILLPQRAAVRVRLRRRTSGPAVIDRSRVGSTVAKERPARIFVAQGGGGEGEVAAASTQTDNSILSRK